MYSSLCVYGHFLFLDEQRSTETTSLGSVGSDLRLIGVGFGNSSRIYGINAFIYNIRSAEKREVYQGMEGEDAGVLLFIGENDDIVLVSSTVL